MLIEDAACNALALHGLLTISILAQKGSECKPPLIKSEGIKLRAYHAANTTANPPESLAAYSLPNHRVDTFDASAQ